MRFVDICLLNLIT